MSQTKFSWSRHRQVTSDGRNDTRNYAFGLGPIVYASELWVTGASGHPFTWSTVYLTDMRRYETQGH